MWLALSLLSALFASLTAILAKIGINNVPSNLAVAIRTFVVLLMSWLMVFITSEQSSISLIDKKSWIFLIFSGITTGLSWLFYYKALQSGKVTGVVAVDKLSTILTFILAFVILKEKMTIKSILGCLFIATGSFFVIS